MLYAVEIYTANYGGESKWQASIWDITEFSVYLRLKKPSSKDSCEYSSQGHHRPWSHSHGWECGSNHGYPLHHRERFIEPRCPHHELRRLLQVDKVWR